MAALPISPQSPVYPPVSKDAARLYYALPAVFLLLIKLSTVCFLSC